MEPDARRHTLAQALAPRLQSQETKWAAQTVQLFLMGIGVSQGSGGRLEETFDSQSISLGTDICEAVPQMPRSKVKSVSVIQAA